MFYLFETILYKVDSTRLTKESRKQTVIYVTYYVLHITVMIAATWRICISYFIVEFWRKGDPWFESLRHYI